MPPDIFRGFDLSICFNLFILCHLSESQLAHMKRSDCYAGCAPNNARENVPAVPVLPVLWPKNIEWEI